MPKIILADDEALIRSLVSDFLAKANYETLEAADGQEAVDLLKQHPDAALMILDVMMPEMDGWEACRLIREFSNLPIIMLTARAEEFDALTGFEAGVDEYVTKPFSPAVLVKRVDALLRRSAPAIKENPAEQKGLVVDKEAFSVFLDGAPVELALKEFEILAMLFHNKNRVFTRDQLLDAIWGYDYVGDTRTVDSHMARLRTKLGAWGAEHLKTIYGIGYKLEL